MGEQCQSAAVCGDIDVEAEIIKNTAQAVFVAFYRGLEERCGKKPPRHSQFESDRSYKEFYQAGRRCVAEQWDPDSYVNAVLDVLRKRHKYIIPKDLNNDQVVGYVRTRMYKGDTTYNVRAEWDYCVRQLLSCIDPANGVTETAILINPFMPFPIWFRLLYPENVDDKMFELYGAAGRREFLASKRLRQFAREVAGKTFAKLEARWGKFGDVEVNNDIADLHKGLSNPIVDALAVG